MEQQYTRITTNLFEAIQKVTSGSSEQKQEVLSEENKKTIYVPPVSHVSPKKPSSSSKDENNRKASMLIDKIRSFRQLKQDYKEKGNLERHREFHTKLHDADKEYQKLGYKSLLRKDDHVVEEVEQLGEAKGLASMTMDQLKQEHEKVKNKIEAEGKSKMISMNHPLSQRARLIRLQMMIKNKQSNEEVEQTDEGAMSDLDADRKDRAYQTRQARTTMKHIANPTPGEKKAAKDIKPGIAGYRDRIAMLKSAEARGGLKKEEAEQFDETIIKEDLNIDAPEQFTFKDYLTAVTSLVGSELEEHQIVAVAYEAFRTQEEDIILEELTRDDLKQKMKAHMDAGHQISGEKFSMKDGKPYGEYVVTDKETGVRRKYIHHGSTRRVENMGSRTKKDAKAND